MASWLGLLHGLDFLLTALLVGSIVFSFWIAPQQKSHSGLLLILLLVTCAWFVGLSIEMAESWKIDELLNVAQHTAFGRLWTAKICLLAGLLGASYSSRLHRLSLLALTLPVFSSLTGHAQAQLHYSAVFIGLDYAHFLGASIWTGGLVCLAVWLRAQLKEVNVGNAGVSYTIVRRFSHFAIASTVTIALSGLILSYLYGVRPFALFNTDYSELVLLKTILFATTLSLASVNQFVHLRRWNPNAEKKFIQGVLRESLFELILIFAVILVAGFLTRTPTPLD